MSVKWYVSYEYSRFPFFGFIDSDGNNMWKGFYSSSDFTNNLLYKNRRLEFEYNYDVRYVSEKYLILRGLI